MPTVNILGPCAAESEEQTMRIARRLATALSGRKFIFRAGIWKPRTAPETFQGVGDIGLQWLLRVRNELQIPVATEVSTPGQVSLALDAGIDYIWLGARTTANPILVQALADAVAAYADSENCRQVTLLVKNPVNEDADLWLGNLRRLSNAIDKSTHNIRLMAIHRGCNHRPCWEMAYRLRQKMPDIPLLLDPSHMSGNADKVPLLCSIANELAYDGLMIEIHDRPQEALSDAKQQIAPETVADILQSMTSATESPTDLTWLRRMMDEVDDDLWEMIAKRMKVSRQIGDYKRANDIEVIQPSRFDEILQRRLRWASGQNISADTVQAVMTALHEESIRVQK